MPPLVPLEQEQNYVGDHNDDSGEAFEDDIATDLGNNNGPHDHHHHGDHDDDDADYLPFFSRETYSAQTRGRLGGIFLLIFFFVGVAATVTLWSEQGNYFGGSRGNATIPDGATLIRFDVSNLDGNEGENGTFVIALRPDWAPIGAKRFENLTGEHFWDECRFFRVIPNFITQFGINGDPDTSAKWIGNNLMDDKVMMTNTRGTVSFATSGANTRTTQIFINTAKHGNSHLDKQGFSPVGEIVIGMHVVDKIYSGYGEKPQQESLQGKGNRYLDKYFPRLSYVRKAVLCTTDKRVEGEEQCDANTDG